MVELWDLTSATIALCSRFKVYSNGVWDVAFSPDGKLLTYGSHDETVGLWDLTTVTAVTVMTTALRETPLASP